MNRNFPIIWIIGATRSSKTALANGLSMLGIPTISTGAFFREKYAQPDTFSREFVFNISAFSADYLSKKPDSHTDHIKSLTNKMMRGCIIEGERNPVEFSKLYNPQWDMVLFLKRLDVPTYDTKIEKGIDVIKDIIRWNIGVGITAPESVLSMSYGLGEVEISQINREGNEEVVMKGPTKPREPHSVDIDTKYPWINIIIGASYQAITKYYGLQRFESLKNHQHLPRIK